MVDLILICIGVIGFLGIRSLLLTNKQVRERGFSLIERGEQEKRDDLIRDGKSMIKTANKNRNGSLALALGIIILMALAYLLS